MYVYLGSEKLFTSLFTPTVRLKVLKAEVCTLSPEALLRTIQASIKVALMVPPSLSPRKKECMVAQN